MLANKSVPMHRRLISGLLLSLALIFAFLSQAPAQISGDKKNQCQVCNTSDKMPKTMNISCKDVTKYLHDHPGSYSGPCTNVSGEKPPKP